MGNLCSSPEYSEQAAVNSLIETDIRRAKQEDKTKIKVLLLGAAESGKSTILKQIKLMQNLAYTPDEMLYFTEFLFKDVLSYMVQIIEAMELLGIKLGDAGLVDYVEIVLAAKYVTSSFQFPAGAGAAIKKLWADSGVMACYSRRSEFHLSDPAEYFFNDIDRISAPGFKVTEQDVLRIRVKTVGIIESKFKIKDKVYLIYDVGGQRSERRKWIHCFETVTAIIFLAAISEYDQVLNEDAEVNRVHEALILFETIANSPYFVDTGIILFFNKKDLFQKKLSIKPLNELFKRYEGGSDYAAAQAYLQARFLAVNKTSKDVYCHWTCATDSDQMKVVMQSVYETIVKGGLKSTGLV